MLAKRGDMSDEEASAYSGYSIATVSNFRTLKDFKDLVAFYKKHSEPLPGPDIIERIQSTGITALDELRERLATDPKAWSKHELMSLTRLLLVDSKGAQEQKPADKPPLRVAIQFVKPSHEELALPTLEHEPVKEIQ